MRRSQFGKAHRDAAEEQIGVDMIRKMLVFHHHKGMTVPIDITLMELPRRKRKVYSVDKVAIPAHTVTKMPIRFKEALDSNVDCIFEPEFETLGCGQYAHCERLVASREEL